MEHVKQSIFTFIFCILISICTSADDGGLGSQYNWMSLSEGLEQAKTEGKPLMLIVHKSWCGACKALKPQFAASADIERLSKYFIMVNTGDDDEPQDKKFAPDGKYVPRIYFLDSSGEVQENIFNEGGNPNYKFYYFSPEGIISSMKKAVKILAIKAPPQEEL